MTVEDLEHAVEDRRPGATVKVRRFHSGTVLLQVIESGRVMVLEGWPDGSWGISPEVGPDEVFEVGHPSIHQSFDAAAACLLRTLDRDFGH